MVKIPKSLRVILVIICVGLLISYAENVFGDKAIIYKGKVKKTELGEKAKAGNITITTEAGDMTFDVTDKTRVRIIDIEKKLTKTYIGLILSEEKDGVDKADTAVITSKDKVTATKIVATTTRRMSFNREEVEIKTEEILRGNADVAEKVKIATENPGTIKGKVKVFAKTNDDIIVYIEKVGNNNFACAQKQYVPKAKGLVSRKAYGSPLEYPVMDQLSMEFTPHVLPVLKGSFVDFPYRDTVKHNVFSPDSTPGTREKINLGTYHAGVIKSLQIPGSGEMALLCNVHSDMLGYVVALENPYFAVTDRKGNFTIENVPAGSYTLKTWHERYKSVSRDVAVDAGKVAMVTFPKMKKKK